MEALEKFLLEEFYWLHRHPELSFQEVETTAHLRDRLEEYGFRVLDLPLKTGIVAELGEGGPVTALRADIAVCGGGGGRCLVYEDGVLQGRVEAAQTADALESRVRARIARGGRRKRRVERRSSWTRGRSTECPPCSACIARRSFPSVLWGSARVL